MFYSARNAGFFDPSIHGANIPSDAVEITREFHQALLTGQSAGRAIGVGADGLPELQDAPVAAIGEADVDRERVRRLAAGSAFAVTGIASPIPLTGKEFDMSIYLGLMLRANAYKSAGVTAAVLPVRDGANVNQLLTPDQMLELIGAAMVWVEDVMKVSWAMKDGTGDFVAGIPADFDDDQYWP
jgi:hypothetical protein